METIRSFLAIRLNIEVVHSLAKVQTKLRDFCDESRIKVAWVPPPNLHVTMRFLGQVTEPMSNALQGMLKPVIAGFHTFELEVSGLGTFPNPERPRIIWAGLKEGSEEIVKLYDLVSARLVSAGFNIDEKPFRSHVTLGRIKGGTTDALSSYILENDMSWGMSTVRNLYCYRSDLKPTGAEHHVLWRLPFVGHTHRIEPRKKPAKEPIKEPINNSSKKEESKSEEPHDGNTE
jgi:2'-5' RNA ligase